MPDTTQSTNGARDREIREKLLSRLAIWRDEGYDVQMLEDTIHLETDIVKVKGAFIAFNEKVKALREIGVQLSLLNCTGFEAKASDLKARLHNVSSFERTKAEFEGLKAALDARKAKGTERKGPERDAHLAKVADWSKKGYEVKKLDNFIRTEPDLEKVNATITALEKKVNVLDKVRLALTQLASPGLEDDIRRVERMVNQMERTDLIWKEVLALREKAKQRRKQVVQAEASTKPVKIKLKRKVTPPPKPEAEQAPTKAAEVTEVIQFRRIDLYVQMVQNILLVNKRLLTLDTLRLAQRALKNDFPKIMFFIIQPDFKIKSMMPDNPDSYKALEAFLNKLYSTLSGLLGEDEAKDRLRSAAKEYITAHIQEILASGLDDYFPMFLIIDDSELPDDTLDVEGQSAEEEWAEIVGRVKAWLNEGYQIERLVQAMEGNKELAMALFRKTEEEIFWLKELERDLQVLEKKIGPRKELEEIHKKLKQPERITEIEDDLLSIQMMVDMGNDSNQDSDLI